MKTIAIVPAAGYGRRLGLNIKKPFVPLAGKPLAAHALAALNRCRHIDAIIVAAERSSLKKFKDIVKRYRLDKVVRVVAGGKTRFESVRNCLNEVGEAFDVVLVHDGARPFIDDELIRSSIRLAMKHGACIAAVPESDTVKLVDRRLFISETLDRNRIFRAQTPQAFRRELIKRAYRNLRRGRGHSRGCGATDDSALVEALGVKVRVLSGSYRNIKITTKEDLKIAEVLI